MLLCNVFMFNRSASFQYPPFIEKAHDDNYKKYLKAIIICLTEICRVEIKTIDSNSDNIFTIQLR